MSEAHALRMSKKLLDIAKKTTEPYRKQLNKKVHVMDFSYSALKVSDPKLTLEEYTELLSVIHTSGKFTRSVSLDYTMRKIRADSTNIGFKAIVDDAELGTFIVASSFGTLQKTLSSLLKQVEGSTSTLLRKNEKGVWQSNIGHISSHLLEAATSPLEALLKDISKRAPLEVSNKIISNISALQNAHDFEASYVFQRPNYDTKRLNKILGQSTVLVTLHSFEVNNTLAKNAEKPIINQVKKYLESDEFIQDVLRAKGSPSIIDDITEGLRAALQGKKYFSTHNKKPVQTVKEKGKSAPNVAVYKPPQSTLRNLRGQFYSLTSLQVLINTHLQSVISANMGDGNSRSILNYRTGRFAASANVDRLTQSREGMITAYYTYLRNPYQTFAPGFAQGHIKSRDPKLLISKSIREIAATKVGNRLRAVSV